MTSFIREPRKARWYCNLSSLPKRISIQIWSKKFLTCAGSASEARHLMRKSVKRRLAWTAVAVAALLIAGVSARFAYLSWTEHEPNFHGSFGRNGDGQQRQAGWQAFGGTWQVIDGAMFNIADDR